MVGKLFLRLITNKQTNKVNKQTFTKLWLFCNFCSWSSVQHLLFFIAKFSFWHIFLFKMITSLATRRISTSPVASHHYDHRHNGSNSKRSVKIGLSQKIRTNVDLKIEKFEDLPIDLIFKVFGMLFNTIFNFVLHLNICCFPFACFICFLCLCAMHAFGFNILKLVLVAFCLTTNWIWRIHLVPFQSRAAVTFVSFVQYNILVINFA